VGRQLSQWLIFINLTYLTFQTLPTWLRSEVGTRLNKGLDKTMVTRIGRFLIVGVTATGINMASMFILMEYLFSNGDMQYNAANFLSMSIGVFAAFTMNRHWTWRDVSTNRKTGIWRQFLLYCAAAGAGLILRIILFALLNHLAPIHYLVNVIIGIGAAAFLDFILYNRYVFRASHQKGA